MTFDEYQKQAESTARFKGITYMGVGDTVGEKRLMIAALGLAGEAGEVCDLIKKVLGHGHPFDKTKLVKEIGDCIWYVSELASALGISLSDVATGNSAKLKARYPEGFTIQNSLVRNTEDV